MPTQTIQKSDVVVSRNAFHCTDPYEHDFIDLLDKISIGQVTGREYSIEWIYDKNKDAKTQYDEGMTFIMQAPNYQISFYGIRATGDLEAVFRDKLSKDPKLVPSEYVCGGVSFGGNTGFKFKNMEELLEALTIFTAIFEEFNFGEIEKPGAPYRKNKIKISFNDSFRKLRNLISGDVDALGFNDEWSYSA